MAEITGPIYPLGKPEFIRALATGHGRALIHCERCGTDGVRNAILDAALFSKVYDTQCNGHGEAWLARLCASAGLVDTIVSRDHGITADDGSLRCALLKEFALRGHEEARSALRDMCRYDEDERELLACQEIVEAEGEVGFAFVADRVGEVMLTDKEYWGPPVWLVSVLDESAGDGRAMAILDRESPGNARIAAFREAVLEYQAKESTKPDRTPPPVLEVIAQILSSTQRIPSLSSFGEMATVEDRRRVSGLDFGKMERISLENYLIYFSRTGFPEFREEYLTLLQHPEEQVRWWAGRALSNHAETQVRLAAYDALERGEVAVFVRLLRRSGLPVDVEPLLEAINAPEIVGDDDEAHGIAGSLRDLAKENEKMNDLRLPMWIYEQISCRICRYEAVKIMVERSTLPQGIAEECLSDASEGTREVAAEYLGVERKF